MNRRQFCLASVAGLAALALPGAAKPRQPGEDLSQASAAGQSANAPLSHIFQVNPLPLEGLSEKARRVASTQIKSIVHELPRQWPPDFEDTSPDHIHLFEAPAGTVACQYFCKVVELDPDGQPPAWAVDATVKTFGRLVDSGWLDYGVLLAPSWFSLGHSCPYPYSPGCLRDCQPCPKRALMMFYAFPALTPTLEWIGTRPLNVSADELWRQLLNQHLGNNAFMREGEVGNADWTGLLGG